MRMKCLACKRPMTQTAFLTHLGMLFAKQLGPIAAQGLIRIITNYFGFTKGVFDEIMATVANDLSFECPKCKKATCWEAAPKEEDDEELELEKTKLSRDINNDEASF